MSPKFGYLATANAVAFYVGEDVDADVTNGLAIRHDIDVDFIVGEVCLTLEIDRRLGFHVDVKRMHPPKDALRNILAENQ
mgnify:CR=1 FL=1